MTINPKEGIPLAALLAVLACLTFLTGVYYGRVSAPQRYLVIPARERRTPVKAPSSVVEVCKPRYECMRKGMREN
jgi:hypothetical protein